MAAVFPSAKALTRSKTAFLKARVKAVRLRVKACAGWASEWRRGHKFPDSQKILVVEDLQEARAMVIAGLM